MAQWGALVTQPNRALELYRDKDFPLDVSHVILSALFSRSFINMFKIAVTSYRFDCYF